MKIRISKVLALASVVCVFALNTNAAIITLLKSGEITATNLSGVVATANDIIVKNNMTGTVSTLNLMTGGYKNLLVGNSTPGTLNVVQGGNLKANARIVVGDNANGVLNMSGGILTAGSTFEFAARTNSSIMNLSGNGVITATTSLTFMATPGTTGTGTVNWDIASDFTSTRFVVDGQGASALGTTVFNFDLTDVALSGSFVLIDNTSTGTLNASLATFNYIGLRSGLSANVAVNGNNDLLLTVAPIPEPATIGMLGLGAVITLLLRRKCW